MEGTYQLVVVKKGDQTFASMSDAPVKEQYALLYGAIRLVSQKTNRSVKGTLAALAGLDDFLMEQERKRQAGDWLEGRE